MVVSANHMTMRQQQGGGAMCSKMIRCWCDVFTLVTLIVWGRTAMAIRVQGTLPLNGILHYQTRFGAEGGHSFLVYGWASSDGPPVVLALLPQNTWNDLFKQAAHKSVSCKDIYEESLAKGRLQKNCSSGTEDYIRTVPCGHNGSGDYSECNQPPNSDVIKGYNFTFHVDSNTTEFYYLAFLTCTISTSDCSWEPAKEASITYQIHLVNKRPSESDPYTNEFSYELQGTLTLRLLFTIVYIFLIATHFFLHINCCRKQKYYSMHVLVKLFTASLIMEGIYVLAELMHSSIYASNGTGAVALKYIGEVFNQFSDWLLILVVILVGKGWQVTTSSLRWSKLTVLIWGAYIVFSGIFFVWVVISEQVYPLSIQLYHNYQSWAGGIYLAYRLFILVYLLYEMRQVYLIENRSTALRLYVILAVCYIVWFCYLPLLTLLGLAVNPVRRLIVTISVYFVFDLLINIGMVLLFCPRWSHQYFQFDHYINVLRHSSHTYRSLKSYGGSEYSSVASSDIPAPV